MPTGNELVKTFLKYTHTRYNLAIVDFDDSIDNDLTTTDQGIADLQSATALPQPIKDFLDCFLETNLSSQFMIDNFPIPNAAEIIDFTTDDFKKRNRSFCISDAQFGYLATKKLLKFSPLTTIVVDVEGYRTLIDFVAAALYIPNNALLNDFFTILESNEHRRGLMVHKYAHTLSSIGIYSYLYYKELLAGGMIDLDTSLNYTGNHGAVVAFNPATVYQQYFELFDIINEINHSNEIIGRFLKVYHLLEYLVYRVELVKVEVKARVNRTFIREIHGLAGKGAGDKEWEIFRKNFAVITANYFSLGVLAQNQKDFFKNYFGLDPYVPTEALKVAQLIYRVRNSIVHNKESEFHMTTTNPDDYRVVIGLLVDLIEKLERVIYDKISGDFDAISYKSPSIELY
jgi:hypothetical protein